jgi:hypothetical protein
MPEQDATRQDPQPPPPYDMESLNALAGVLSGSLVAQYPKAMNVGEACDDSERKLDDPAERGEVVVAFWLLVAYGLADPIQDEQWVSTLAAVKAEQLSF